MEEKAHCPPKPPPRFDHVHVSLAASLLVKRVNLLRASISSPTLYLSTRPSRLLLSRTRHILPVVLVSSYSSPKTTQIIALAVRKKDPSRNQQDTTCEL